MPILAVVRSEARHCAAKVSARLSAYLHGALCPVSHLLLLLIMAKLASALRLVFYRAMLDDSHDFFLLNRLGLRSYYRDCALSQDYKPNLK